MYWAQANLNRSRAGISGLEGGREGEEGSWIEVTLDMLLERERERERDKGEVKREGKIR